MKHWKRPDQKTPTLTTMKEGRKEERKDGWMDVLIDGWTELTQYKGKL